MRHLMIGAAAALLVGSCSKVDYCDGASTVAKDSALLATQKFVRDGLKAPATARFPTNHRDEGVSLASTGACRWTISAYVDSQNSFGALIRTGYTLVATVNDDGTYQLEYLWLDGEPQT